MDEPKDLPAQVFCRPLVLGRAQLPDQRVECRIDIACDRAEFDDSRRAVIDDAIAPGFRVREHASGQAVAFALCVECPPNCADVGSTHQFADELFLPPKGPMGSHRCGLGDGVPQSLVDRQSAEFVGSQSDQALAELLPRKLLTFLFCFAGICLGHGLSYPA